MAASPFNGPDPLELERPVVFRDIRAIRHEVQGLNTKLQVLNSRLQALEVARPCPGSACTTADVDPTDIRCVECPHNPEVLPLIPDDYQSPP